MNNILRGITYSFHRNIGWQDRAIRSTVAIASIAGAVYFFNANIFYSLLLAGLALAQVATVLSVKCIILYFLNRNTITNAEQKSLYAKGIIMEKN